MNFQDVVLVACDTGGTFTDFVMFHTEKGLSTLKLSSTPENPSLAVLDGIARLCGERPPEGVNHATTVVTNALLERTGGKVCFVTTEGFKDMLWLGRGQRSDLYALAPSRPVPPLSPEHVFEVKERVLADGTVESPLSPTEVERLTREIPRDIDAVAVCLLHSSLRPDHENMIAGSLRVPVFRSHLVAPGSGEYERGMTTLLAAYLSKKVGDYLENLKKELHRSRLMIVHSAGGLLKVEEAQARPHRLALSGPAAGLRGALAIGAACGQTDLVTLDMGGTSTDVALLRDGELPYSWQANLEGYPLRAPTLQIHTIGAGGGSIAFADPSRLLAVGPRSAGAAPGPACYKRGGARPTVTDALCWNGFLPATLGDENLELDRGAAGEALRGLGKSLSLSVEETADGILQIAASHLAEAVRKVTTGQGRDPADFALFPFGGAGPLLACQVAENLSMKSILVPLCAGVLSAWGAMMAPWEREWSLSVPVVEREVDGGSETRWEQLRQRASEETSSDDVTWTRLTARRYSGQGETLVSEPNLDFHQLHLERFGFRRSRLPVETIEVRLRASRNPAKSTASGTAFPSLEELPRGRVRWQTEERDLPVYRYHGALHNPLEGPALLLQSGSTLFLAPGWRARTLAGGHLLLERPES